MSRILLADYNKYIYACDIANINMGSSTRLRYPRS